MSTINLSIVIPVYFNQGSIKKTYDSLLKNVLIKFPSLIYEIIFVDDGSKDKSFGEICDIAKQDSNVKVIRFTRNFGQVSAIYAGYEEASGKGILNISADMQEPPELFVELISSFLNKDAEIISGQRMERDESMYRKKTSKIFYSLMKKLSFENMPDGGFDIVLLDEKVKKFILSSNEVNPFWQGQLLWSGYTIKFIPYNRKKRDSGKSRWTFTKKINYLLDGLLNYSYLPLRLFSIIGIISFLIGATYSILIIVSYLLGYTPFKGWAPIMIVILLFSGLQLIMLGLVGEYLWRTFEQSKNRPKFIIKDRI